MNLRIAPLIDRMGLRIGSEVQIKKYPFLEVQIDRPNGLFTRTWFHIGHNLTAEEAAALNFEDKDLGIKKMVKWTGNKKVIDVLRKKIFLTVESTKDTTKHTDSTIKSAGKAEYYDELIAIVKQSTMYKTAGKGLEGKESH